MNNDEKPSRPCKKCGSEKLKIAGQQGGHQWFDCENGCYANGPEMELPMNEREMLELAARACGHSIDHPWNKMRLEFDPPVIALCIPGLSTGWNPGQVDGHCARMEAKLGIDVEWWEAGVVACAKFSMPHANERASEEFAHHSDRNAARRMASLKVAAAIGKAMT